VWTREKVPGIWGGNIRGILLGIWNLRGFIDWECRGPWEGCFWMPGKVGVVGSRGVEEGA
jgi:hypothetical protein